MTEEVQFVTEVDKHQAELFRVMQSLGGTAPGLGSTASALGRWMDAAEKGCPPCRDSYGEGYSQCEVEAGTALNSLLLGAASQGLRVGACAAQLLTAATPLTARKKRTDETTADS